MRVLKTNEEQPLQVLVVDDKPVALRHFARVLDAVGGTECHRASSLAEARKVLEQKLIDVAFIDLQLTEDIRNRDGLTLIKEIRGRYQAVPIVVSGHSLIDEVRDAMKQGAADYVLKTEVEQRVPLIIQGFRRELEREQEMRNLRARGDTEPAMGLVGTSVAMQNLRGLIRRMAAPLSPIPVPVLVLGPTGAGKEVVAKALHKNSLHPGEPFFDLNCGAIAETLVEDQLFGHVRGAFTGAVTDQDGYFTLVRRGTLFLDEVAELSLTLQVKLLRVLDERTFRPIGATAREQVFQGRIIAATHVDLRERVREGRFREDLYHRLNMLTIQVPPLAEHREDIPALIQHFASQYDDVRPRDRPIHFTEEAVALLCRRRWDGNIRELRNTIGRLIILSESGTIDGRAVEQDLPADSPAAAGEEALRRFARKILELPIPDKIGAITEALVKEARDQTRGSVTETARILGRHRKFVERFLKKQPGTRKPKDSPP